MSAQIYVANESAVLYAGGQQYVVHKGVTRVRDGHPLLKRNSHMFKPLDVHYDVEQATAEPGEKRDLDTPSTRAVREWAQQNGYNVPSRGKLPAEVVEAYKAAQDT
ncbi:Lsr2 family DNA-binding protein [Prauserella endophytica]|uniref:Lsr2 DNA-binding domain-containing protein n=1 Tax=Prauserella endophytica TaxID=1592324 RepID=A0ABY2RUI1_9PSEU|nr:histone-like nucleoid-structuring protein Lsr2 [Prauserella endophytica]TKG58892.1 hypothetical protein FCN18_37400 [Prauserella endophytica]